MITLNPVKTLNYKGFIIVNQIYSFEKLKIESLKNISIIKTIK